MNGNHFDCDYMRSKHIRPASSHAGSASPQKETPLAGRRASDAIAGGVRLAIVHAQRLAVKSVNAKRREA